jgi:tetratricopeptide (TPR) repeat protein
VGYTARPVACATCVSGHFGTFDGMEQLTPPDAASGRLGSWKEIAVFFSKDVRTVKRWEKDRALPVHRAPGKPGGSVYAFTDELTNWLNASSTKLEEVALDAEVAAATKARPSVWSGVFAIIILVLIGAVGAALAWFYYSPMASGSSRTSSPSSRGSSNPEAVDLYLKGRFEWSKRSPESLNKAVDYFTQAIVRDPNYAQAYAGLADTYDLLREYSAMPSEEAYPRAIAAAKKAVELDDSLSEAHRALAFATYYWVWDFAAGEREFKRAIELDPKDAVAHHWYGTAIGAVARYPEALSQLDQARQLDPSSVSIQADRAVFLWFAGQETEGLSILKQIEQTDPAFISPHRYLAAVAIVRGDYPVYLAEFRKVAELSQDKTGMEIVKAGEHGFATGGAKALLDSERQILEKYYDEGVVPGYRVAQICAESGKNQEAIHYLQEAFTRHDSAIVDIKSDPSFRNLHDDPAFKDLVLRVGLHPIQ